MHEYFNYFTEIEERFQRRRGSLLILSTLDWALIETWKDAGIPLEAVLRGIDETFDKYERRPSKTRKVNSLAYCSQEVLAASESMKEAAVGAQRDTGEAAGLGAAEITAFLSRSADEIARAPLPAAATEAAQSAAASLRAIASELQTAAPQLEDLERRLNVIEEKLYAALLHATSEQDMLAARAEADRAIAPYRSKMIAAQIDQLHRQFVHKRLLERFNLPRLSLFYM